jgi:hypothetical protein
MEAERPEALNPVRADPLGIPPRSYFWSPTRAEILYIAVYSQADLCLAHPLSVPSPVDSVPRDDTFPMAHALSVR